MIEQTAIISSSLDHRTRLLEGMARCVATKGYADTTIADIATAARVSKRTFYEHFRTKQECLIALYENASQRSISSLSKAIEPSQDWTTRVDQAVKAYFGHLAANPLLMRTLFIDVLAVGSEGLQARRKVHRQLADLIADLPQQAEGDAAAWQANAIVGALTEIVLQAIEQDRVEQLPECADGAAQVVRAAIQAHRSSTPEGRALPQDH
ncbi:TetR/AcrR family transcriptional regulator [Sphaerotilus natans]|uniref:TetR/AcrR family transcriptional regulator n=1 Tax=Sphaerotilus natans TaxID=34103 RepID=UPI00406C6C64